MILTAYLIGFCGGFCAAIIAALWISKSRDPNK